jgi:adenine-specific DNA-methyltransferase
MLAESNVREWDTSKSSNLDNLQEQLKLGVEHLRPDRTELDIVYEVLLKSGFTLSETVTTETVAGHTVYSVSDGVFLICLEHALTLDFIRAVADRKPERVLFLDRGFASNDQLKANAAQTFKNKNIVFRTL